MQIKLLKLIKTNDFDLPANAGKVHPVFNQVRSLKSKNIPESSPSTGRTFSINLNEKRN